MIYENTPTLKTENLILRKFQTEDSMALFEILSDVEVNTFLPWFPLKTLEDAKTFLRENFLNHYNAQTAYRYAICQKSNNIPIGYIGLSRDESNDLGYGLKKDFWGNGIVTQSAKAVVDRIGAAGYSYITATHDINNLRSGAVMKKLGMQYKYSYVEQVQPKDVSVIFRMYQLNFDTNSEYTFMKYWNKYKNHYVETDV